jgi:hypothetical protein
MKQVLIVATVLVLLMVVAGCAPGPNTMADSPDQEGEVAGFWLGLWQGIITPVTFIISLFSEKVHMYEVHNNRGWYNFGYLLGMMIILGGGSGSAARRRRRD